MLKVVAVGFWAATAQDRDFADHDKKISVGSGALDGDKYGEGFTGQAAQQAYTVANVGGKVGVDSVRAFTEVLTLITGSLDVGVSELWSTFGNIFQYAFGSFWSGVELFGNCFTDILTNSLNAGSKYLQNSAEITCNGAGLWCANATYTEATTTTTTTTTPPVCYSDECKVGYREAPQSVDRSLLLIIIAAIVTLVICAMLVGCYTFRRRRAMEAA